MAWIKNAIIDLGVTAVIAVYAFTGATWAWWIIAIYTPLMVLLKVFGLSSAAAAVQQKASDVPTWFYHFLFAANVVLLLRAFSIALLRDGRRFGSSLSLPRQDGARLRNRHNQTSRNRVAMNLC